MEQTLNNIKPARIIDAIRVLVAEKWLLFPMAAVAEVVRSGQVVNRENDSPYLHGWLQWRDSEIPLLAYEMLLAQGGKLAHAGTVNALVINTLGKGQGMDFYAILIDDLPQPAHITEASDFTESTETKGQYELMKVVLDGLDAVVPDLLGLERLIRAET